MSCKKYVTVTAQFDEKGNIMPTAILWDDGTQFEIDKVLDVRPAVSLKAGGTGIRYTCRIEGHEKFFVFWKRLGGL
ncbi:MAG TPA: hypothetical protein VHP38_10160 [Ruminiclostridium sp.]|nr:hypothetical protein [Ruminiclostridium sp.]